MLLTCESGSDDYVISALKSIDSVKSVVGVFGTYDLLAKLEADTEEKIRDIITKKIRKIQRIRATCTLMVNDKNGFPNRTVIGKDILNRYMSQAYVLLECDKNYEKYVINNLSTIPEVVDGDVLIDQYQIICNIMAPTYNDISDIVTKKIRKIPNIKGTITLNVIGQPS